MKTNLSLPSSFAALSACWLAMAAPGEARAAAGLLNPAGIWHLDGNFGNSLPGQAALLPAGLVNGTDFTFATDESGYQYLQAQPFTPATKRLTVTNPIAPNGGPGATRTNQWTAVMDVKFDALQPYAGFLQLDPANAGDVTFYVASTNNLNGALNAGLSSAGAIAVKTWHRLAITCGNNGAGGPTTVKFYLNGVPNGTPRTSTFNGTLSLQSTFHLLSDNNNELKPAKLNSFALWGEELSAGDIALLGAPQTGGIQPRTRQYSWRNLAGEPGGTGSENGFGPVARFDAPSGIGVDGSGNVYVADTNNHTIRKVTPAGGVSVLAGSPGLAGHAGGFGEAARFRYPRDIAVDSTGNVYAGDSTEHVIRKISPAGEVTTLAGLAGTSGSTDGVGGAARFKTPYGIAVDTTGNIYVGDRGNATIRRITPAGEVTTLAGSAGQTGSVNGQGSTARFLNLTAMAVDSAGNIYVTDGGSVRIITATGLVSTLAGVATSYGNVDGPAETARFFTPSGLVVDGSGNVFVVQTNTQTLRKVTTSGVVSTVAGASGENGSINGSGVLARFSFPYGIAKDGGGTMYVTDGASSAIRKVTPAILVSIFVGTPEYSGTADGSGNAARFDKPQAIAVHSSGDLYVADGTRIRKVTSAGVVSTPPGFAGTSPAYDPNGIVVDDSRNIYFTDGARNNIQKIDPSGVVTTFAGSLDGLGGTTNGQGTAARFRTPIAIAGDAAGNLYVTDWNNHVIRKITASGEVSTFAGTAQMSGIVDATGSAARFTFPRGIAVDSAGNVYVSDESGHTIRKITPERVVTTLAGSAGNPGSADGTGSLARFDFPRGLAVDRSGNVYVGDWRNQTIRRVTPGGVVTTIGGMAKVGSGVDAIGSAARFSFPDGIAVNAAGVLFVADAENNRISRGTLFGTIAAWRMEYFQTTEDAGNAANLFDYDHDGLVNLLEYAFGTNPLTGGPEGLPQIRREGPDLQVSFIQPDSVSDITYGAEWSTTLAAGSWTAIPDSGMGGFHSFRLPVTEEPRMFMRLTVKQNQ